MVTETDQGSDIGIRAEPLLLLDLKMGTPIEIGVIDGISRRCVPIVGGSVSGPFNGTVLAGGADWQQLLPDGSIEIQARYVLELTDGRVEVDSRGIRTGSSPILAQLARGETVDPSQIYFRTAVRFRTESRRMAWLNHLLAISSGERLNDRVRLAVYEVK